MAGQGILKSVKEVKSTIKSIETNTQMGGGGGGTEMGSNGKVGTALNGKK